MKTVIPALAVQSVSRSLDFYVRVLGFTADQSLADDAGEIMHGSVSSGSNMIMFGPMPLPPGQEAGTGVELYLNVDDAVDIDEAFERAVAAGANVAQPPMDQFWGDRNWAITDPDGYRLVVGKQLNQLSLDEMKAAMTSAMPV